MWTCPKRQSKVDDGFAVCWSCGTSPSGDEDPSFEHADRAKPSWAASTALAKKKVDDDPDFAPAEPQVELVACYWARNSNEAMFLALQLRFEGSRAAADFHDLRAVFAGFGGFVPAGPYFSPRVWALAGDVPEARAWLAAYEERRRTRTKRRRGWSTWA
jgi:hypothetical protein